MPQEERDQSPGYDFGDDDGRAGVRKSQKNPEYIVGDKVFLTVSGVKEGPYTVATVKPDTLKYTLSLDDGQSAKNGQEVDEKDLGRS